MRYDVVSLSLDKEGKYQRKKNGDFIVRTEGIDTVTNELFWECKNAKDVKMAYECFWKLDKHWKKGQCKVLLVVTQNGKE